MSISDMIQKGQFVKFKLHNGEWAYGRVVALIPNQALLNVKLCNGSSFFPNMKDAIPMNDFEVRLLCLIGRNLNGMNSCVCFPNIGIF